MLEARIAAIRANRRPSGGQKVREPAESEPDDAGADIVEA